MDGGGGEEARGAGWERRGGEGSHGHGGRGQGGLGSLGLRFFQPPVAIGDGQGGSEAGDESRARVIQIGRAHV